MQLCANFWKKFAIFCSLCISRCHHDFVGQGCNKSAPYLWWWWRKSQRTCVVYWAPSAKNAIRQHLYPLSSLFSGFSGAGVIFVKNSIFKVLEYDDGCGNNKEHICFTEQKVPKMQLDSTFNYQNLYIYGFSVIGAISGI